MVVHSIAIGGEDRGLHRVAVYGLHGHRVAQHATTIRPSGDVQRIGQVDGYAVGRFAR